MMRVLLADDQTSVRSALRLALQQEPDLQVVGEAAEATGLLLAAATQAPDLLLLDWELPGLPMVQLLRLLKVERPSLKILAMSSLPEAEQPALDAGAGAFLSKSEPPQRVLALVRQLLANQSDKQSAENEAGIAL